MLKILTLVMITIVTAGCSSMNKVVSVSADPVTGYYETSSLTVDVPMGEFEREQKRKVKLLAEQSVEKINYMFEKDYRPFYPDTTLDVSVVQTSADGDFSIEYK